MRWLALVLFVSSCFGAETNLWKPIPVSTAPDTTLRSLYFLDEKTGWLAGDKGTCLSTTDGGATWSALNTGSDASLRCVRFNSAQVGFLCGDGDSQAPAAKGHFVMLRPNKCGSVLTTSDGGKTWKKGWVPGNFEVWCIEGSATPVLQVGNGSEEHLDGDIIRSKDNGVSWEERRVFRSLSDIRALDEKRWVAVGSPVSVGFSGTINDPAYLAKKCRALFSRDGGKTWTPSKGSDGETVLRGMLARKEGPLFAVGDAGAIVSSTDAGETWTAVKNSETASLRSVTATPDGKVLVAVGERGIFIWSTDSGATWKNSWVGKSENLFSVACVNGKFIAVGDHSSVFACDAGELSRATALPSAPPPPKEPVKLATAEQKARVRVGDLMVYGMKLKAPALKMDLDYQVKITVAAVTDEEFSMNSEVIKGTPPAGMPMKSDDKVPIASLPLKANEFEKGKSKEEKVKGNTITSKRLDDETVELDGKKLECLVAETIAELAGGAGHSNSKSWYCTQVLPLFGLVKMETNQSMNLPNGSKMDVTQTQELIEWKRGQ